jgi:murein DD-endopeptidase MepM/ murein hydrolase activator NlpD
MLTLGCRRQFSLTALTAFLLLFSPLLAENALAQAEAWLKWPVSGNISANVAWHLAVENVRAVDIRNKEGTPIAAAHSGTVTYAGTTSQWFSCTFVKPHRMTEGGGYGNFVVIRHDGGQQTYYTMYAHLSSVAVTIGQQVITGEFIGRMGSTGCSSGPHVHFVVGTQLRGPPQGDAPTPYIAESSSLWGGPDPSDASGGLPVDIDAVVDGSNYPGLGGTITLLSDALQVDEVWTAAEDFQRKDVFDCGERINYVASVTNTSARTIVANFAFYAKDPVPDDPFHVVVEDTLVFPGTADFYLPFTLPSSLPPPGDGTYFTSISVRNTSLNIYDIGSHPFSIRPDRCR